MPPVPQDVAQPETDRPFTWNEFQQCQAAAERRIRRGEYHAAMQARFGDRWRHLLTKPPLVRISPLANVLQQSGIPSLHSRPLARSGLCGASEQLATTCCCHIQASLRCPAASFRSPALKLACIIVTLHTICVCQPSKHPSTL